MSWQQSRKVWTMAGSAMIGILRTARARRRLARRMRSQRRRIPVSQK
jgi:hypothetical protein